MKVAILGGTGSFGRALAVRLVALGEPVDWLSVRTESVPVGSSGEVGVDPTAAPEPGGLTAPEPGVLAAQMDALRHHFDQRRRQHETCSERDEVAEVGALPILLDDDGATEDVRARGGQAQQQTGEDRRH